nr:MAG TPA: hypothetical protein [Caudoviricetes sp.]
MTVIICYSMIVIYSSYVIVINSRVDTVALPQ